MGSPSRDGQGQLSLLPSEELAELPRGDGSASIVPTAGHQWVRDLGGETLGPGEGYGAGASAGTERGWELRAAPASL